jgi:hypothetical protein
VLAEAPLAHGADQRCMYRHIWGVHEACFARPRHAALRTPFDGARHQRLTTALAGEEQKD